MVLSASRQPMARVRTRMPVVFVGEYRELGLQVALAQFGHRSMAAKQLADMTGNIIRVVPFESCLVYGIRLVEIVSDAGLSLEEIRANIKDLGESTDAAFGLNEQSQNKRT
jgi:hypothetical protein